MTHTHTKYAVRVWVLNNLFDKEHLTDDFLLQRTIHPVADGYINGYFSDPQMVVISLYFEWADYSGIFKDKRTSFRHSAPGDYIELIECDSNEPMSYLYRIDRDSFTLVRSSQVALNK